jgi:hypothetical protein
MFMQDNPGKAISGDVMDRDIVGFTREALLQSAAMLANENPQMKRVGAGVYMWVEEPPTTETDLIVEGTKFVGEVILTAPNGSIVLKAGDQLYRLVPIDL